MVLKVVNMFSKLDLTIEHFFHAHVASSKLAAWNWGGAGSENSRELCKPGALA